MIFQNKFWKKFVIYIFGGITLLFILVLFTKNSLFRYILQSKIDDFNQEHTSKIYIKDYGLKGFRNIYFDHICITQHNDTVFLIDSIFIRFNLWKTLFGGDINIKEIYSQNINFNLMVSDTSDSFSLLFKKEINDTTNTIIQKKPNFRKKSSLLFNTLFNLLPQQGNISNVNIFVKRPEKETIHISVPFIDIKHSIIKMPIYISDAKSRQILKTVCAVDADQQQLHTICVHQRKKTDFVPGFYNAKLKIQFDTAYFSLRNNIQDEMLLEGIGNINNLIIFHPSLSTSEINFKKLSSNFLLRIDDTSIELDSSSTFTIEPLHISIYSKYAALPFKQIEVKINEPNINAEEFFAALPEGLFPNTFNIKAKGKLSYQFYFWLNFNQIDSLKLFSELRPINFRIVSFGKLNLSKIDSDFIHTVYEYGEPVETIHISRSNPNYIPLDQISPYLRNALLCTEDGGFYWHRGFLLDAFREAMIENIKKKRFARGGSTITMQLVKNLYLNRYKVISRKLEEMLIVWLIENMRLASKDRLFELYLNIIEFGPGIYGISKATHFYFNKKPHELNLPEAIFLASIVPKPKHFVSSFDSTGILKPSVQDFMKFVAKKMLDKQMIREDEWQQFTPNIILTGPAKEYINKPEN